MRPSTCAIYLALVLLAWTDLLVAAESPPGATTYVYKGHQVSAAWLDQQYVYFKDKIAVVDGKFYDIGKALVQIALARHFPLDNWPCYVTETPPAVGEARLSAPVPTSYRPYDILTHATVLQIVAKDEAIITSGHLLFHVRGIDPPKQIDGTRFEEVLLVYAGTYQYVNTMGAKRTVQSFVVYQPVTREQFAKALTDGFQLVRYRTVTKKVPEWQGGSVGNGFNVQPSKKVMVEKSEVVAQPVEPPAGAPLVDNTPPGAQAPASGDDTAGKAATKNLELARVFRRNGFPDKAEAILKQIVNDYPNTTAAEEARQQLKEIQEEIEKAQEEKRTRDKTSEK